MKVLVFGASGLLGRELCTLLKKNDINYLGTYNTNKVENSVYINFENNDEIISLINNYNPTICIICIVQRLTDICESNWNETKKTNIDIVTKISKICKNNNFYVIHISSDYVFDGKNPPYLPSSLPNPLQNYGISKLISEYKISNYLKKYSIIRVPVLYSNNTINYNESAITMIGKKVLNNINKYTEDNFSIRRPVFIQDLCYFLLDIINNTNNYQGIYHFYNNKDKTTKYEIATLIGKYLNKDTNHIIPINIEPNDGAERPYDTNLLDNNYDINKFNITTIDEGIKLCFNKIYHPKIYSSTSNIFILLDLDGTLIDSNKLHIESYNKTFNLFNLNLNLNLTENDININDYLKYNIKDDVLINKIKSQKIKFLLESKDTINLINGAEKIIKYISENNINHCVVTNTSSSTVKFFKDKVPILNNLTNWVTREDYSEPKPNSECYNYAIKNYFKNEKYIIGFEDSYIGYCALKNITNIIYIIYNNIIYEKIKNEDVYFINNYNVL